MTEIHIIGRIVINLWRIMKTEVSAATADIINRLESTLPTFPPYKLALVMNLLLLVSGVICRSVFPFIYFLPGNVEQLQF